MKKLRFSTLILVVMLFGVATAWFAIYCNCGINITEDNIFGYVLSGILSVLVVVVMYALARGIDDWEDNYRK